MGEEQTGQAVMARELEEAFRGEGGALMKTREQNESPSVWFLK